MRYPTLIRGLILAAASVSAFGQRIPAANRAIYPFERNLGPGLLGLSDSQMRQLEQARKDNFAVVLDDSQRASLTAIGNAMQAAYEAAALGLIKTDWQFSCLCDGFRSVIKALDINSAQLDRLSALRASASAAGRKLVAKQGELEKLLTATSEDVVSIGQMTIDIERLRKQVPGAPAVLNDARALLNDAQQTKLLEIEQAVHSAKEAVRLGLMDTPWQWRGGECLCN